MRLRLADDPPLGAPDGAWWPRSRDLQDEAADLVDHFPDSAGHIYRLLFSRPDWDHSTNADGGGVRKIAAARGPVKVGSFPSDDTHLMILTMSSGRHLRLAVIPSSATHADGERLLSAAGAIDTTPGDGADRDRWDNEGGHD
ncbi:DUF5994 family protein [Nocardioides sp. SR21]|uniref:DUF5994 family protein n=1 Tax=Nocardioides sp. SR21 TaxID=2919501 RepID=UPI001FAAF0D7|nr:DUF5994 family protein [Nocardioides sp. SR21]